MKPKHNKVATLAATLITCGSLVQGTNAATIFDFEDSPAGAFQGSVVVSSGSIDLELSTPLAPDGFLHIGNASMFGAFPLELGAQTLMAFENSVPVFGESLSIKHNFSVDILGAVFVFGDTGGDNDGTAFLELFDSNGTSIDILSQPFGNLNGVLEFNINQTFRSAVFSTDGSESPNSLLQEWRSVTVIPEPSSALLLGLTALGFAARRKRAA